MCTFIFCARKINWFWKICQCIEYLFYLSNWKNNLFSLNCTPHTHHHHHQHTHTSFFLNLIVVHPLTNSVCLLLLIRWNRLFKTAGHAVSLGNCRCACWCVFCASVRKAQRKIDGARDKNNEAKHISRGENVSGSCVRDTGGTTFRGKKWIHHCYVIQRNSTLPAVQTMDVWMCKSSSFVVSLCQRWFTIALRRIAARCLGQSHNSSMYCRINGALIWLVGHVCEREGVCVCSNVCVCV